MSEKRILIIGGGTGGHISPGIALYEYCREKGIFAKFLTSYSDRKFKYLSEIERGDLLYYNAPPVAKTLWKLPFFLPVFFWAYIKVKFYYAKYNITDVIGMGGYVSAPALLASLSKKRRLHLCEQNTVPGKVTKLFLKKAVFLLTTFTDTVKWIKEDQHEKIHCMGNPIRKKALPDMTREQALKLFNLSHCDRVILAIGGSQGAVQLNELVLELKIRYNAEFKNIGLIWSTGAVSYEKYKKIINESSKFGSVYLSPFIEDVGAAYRAADIAISRSGSGVMMELAAVKLPSLLVPYPHATQNHQSLNADVFDRSGASIKIEGEKVTPQYVGPLIFDILHSEPRLTQMKRKCAQEAKVNAARDIIDLIVSQSDADAASLRTTEETAKADAVKKDAAKNDAGAPKVKSRKRK